MSLVSVAYAAFGASASAEQVRKQENDEALLVAARKTATATIFIAAFGALAFAAAIIQAIIFGRQLTTMQRQLDAMEADQRPWVFLENIRVTKPLSVDRDGMHSQLEFSIRNAGRSPAIKVWVGSDWIPMMVGTATLEQVQDKTCNEAKVAPTNVAGLGITIPPNGQIPFPQIKSVSLADMKKSEVTTGKQAVSVMYLMGCVLYKFPVPGDFHTVKFARQIVVRAGDDVLSGVPTQDGTIDEKSVSLERVLGLDSVD
jgi:hypothetical protein